VVVVHQAAETDQGLQIKVLLADLEPLVAEPTAAAVAVAVQVL
jgi:hypothetical protein